MPRKAAAGDSGNRLKFLEERIVDLEKKTKILDQFESAINNLAEQTDKMVTVSINLQAKMTELMIKTTDLTENVMDMVDLLKEAGEIEIDGGKEGASVDIAPVVEELKRIEVQNEESVKEVKNLISYMKKMYTKELIGKAVRTGTEEASGYVI